MAKKSRAPRPTKKYEYELFFGTHDASKKWRDLVATLRNPMVDAWDFLTQTPLKHTQRSYPLKGKEATIVRQGAAHTLWQYKPTLGGSARIWYYVEDQSVYIVAVHTHHPNETK